MVNHSLTRFAACVSIALYIALLFAEYLRPGFVSTVMNVHAMWIVMIPLIIMSKLPTTPGPSFRRRGVYGFGLACLGIILALIVWNYGAVFGGMRFWFSVAVAITPLALFQVRR